MGQNLLRAVDGRLAPCRSIPIVERIRQFRVGHEVRVSQRVKEGDERGLLLRRKIQLQRLAVPPD